MLISPNQFRQKSSDPKGEIEVLTSGEFYVGEEKLGAFAADKINTDVIHYLASKLAAMNPTTEWKEQRVKISLVSSGAVADFIFSFRKTAKSVQVVTELDGLSSNAGTK